MGLKISFWLANAKKTTLLILFLVELFSSTLVKNARPQFVPNPYYVESQLCYLGFQLQKLLGTEN